MEGDHLGEGGEQIGLVDDEKPKRLIKPGCTFGRIINACIAFDYLLVLLTALIVSGSLGVLNSKVGFLCAVRCSCSHSLVLTAQLANNFPDTSPNNRTCILFTGCVVPEENPTAHCQIEYNSSGGCEFIVAGFGIVGFFALVYMALCIVRLIFATE